MQESGTVKEYDAASGRGRIRRSNGEYMTLFHRNFAPGLVTLNAGDAITYNVLMGATGLIAKNVQKVE